MALAVALLPLPAYAETAPAPAPSGATVVVDGHQVDASAQPVVVDGHTLYPARALAESLGANVAWDAENRTAVITLGSTEIRIPLGSDIALVNGQPVKLDTPATSVDGHTMLPLRFVAETLGAKVDYDATTQTIQISHPEGRPIPPTAPAEPPAPPPQPTGDAGEGETHRLPPGSKLLPDGSIQLPVGTIAREHRTFQERSPTGERSCRA